MLPVVSEAEQFVLSVSEPEVVQSFVSRVVFGAELEAVQEICHRNYRTLQFR